MSAPRTRTLASREFLFALVFLASVALVLAFPALDYLSSDRVVATTGVFLLFTVELPLYFWLIVLRKKGTHPLYAIPVAALGYLFSRWWAQGDSSAWITWGWAVLAPLEALLLFIIARRAWHVVRAARELPRSFDLIERLSMAAGKEFPANRWTGVLAYEVGLIHYALGGRPGIVLRSTDAAFTYHRRSGLRLVYAVALVLGAVEIVGLHLLIAALNTTAAWVLTGFELYGVVWIVGLLRSIGELPIVLGERGIKIRFGVIYTLWVPYEAIEGVQWQRLHSIDTNGGNYLSCAFMNSPDCVLTLRTPTRARLPYTRSRNVSAIGLMVDDPQAFRARLERHLADS